MNTSFSKSSSISPSLQSKQLISTQGKYLSSDVPHQGWSWIDVEDLGKDDWIECQKCKLRQIRYVHHLAHPEYPEVLKVGRNCAAKMEGDPSAPEKREKTLARRAGWIDRGWIYGPRRGFYKRSGKWVIHVYKQDPSWMVTINAKELWQAKDGFETIGDAKKYAFNSIYLFRNSEAHARIPQSRP